MRVDGKTYRLGVHGFAASRDFALEEADDDRIVFVDHADDETRRLYPFGYRLAIEFRLTPSSLRCAAAVTNTGDGSMPYAFGFHPGFRWPAGASARVTFQSDEIPAVPRITPEGLFAASRRPVPFDGSRLDLTRDMFSREALCFLDLRSREFSYEAEGFGRLHVTHEDFPHVALWSRPPAPFLCLESWTGHGDPEGFTGELRDKPSMRLLAPGATACHAATYSFFPTL